MSENVVQRDNPMMWNRFINRHIIMIMIIIVYTFGTYLPVILTKPLHQDDVRNIAFMQDHGPLSGFVNTRENGLWYGSTYYRPFFIVLTWLDYQLFGLDFAGYYIVVLLLHVLASVSIYYVLFRLTRHKIIALLAALVFAAHTFSGVVLWATDTGSLLGVVSSVILILLLGDLKIDWKFYGILFLCLFLAFLNRESGLAIAMALAGCLGYIVWTTRLFSLRQAAAMLMTTFAAGLAYLAMRWLAFDALFLGTPDHSTGYFGKYFDALSGLSSADHVAIYAYTVCANLLGTFFIVFKAEGTLSGEYLFLYGAAPLLVGGIALYVTRRWSSYSVKRLAAVTAALCVGMGGIFIVLYQIGFNLHLSFFFQGVLSVILGYGLLFRAQWSPQHKAAAVFALGLVIANSVVVFAYFRYRNLYLGLIGWLILLGLSIWNLPSDPWHNRVRVVALILVATLIASNGGTLFVDLAKQSHVSPPTQILCKPDIPTDLALDMAKHYNIAADKILECHKISQ